MIPDFLLFSYFQTSLNITELPDTIKPYPDSSPARQVIPFSLSVPLPIRKRKSKSKQLSKNEYRSKNSSSVEPELIQNLRDLS